MNFKLIMGGPMLIDEGGLMKENKSMVVLLGVTFLVFIVAYLIDTKIDKEDEKNAEVTISQEKLQTPSSSVVQNLLHSGQLQEGIEANRLRRERAQERHQFKLDADEAERRRLEHWKANFPYKKTYHPTLTFDRNRYDPSGESMFSIDYEMRRAVKDHGFLVAFYNNPQIYSAEFEQLFHLLVEIDRADHPMITAKIFNNLIHYHKLQRFDQDALWSRRENLPYPNATGKHLGEFNVPVDGKTTWGDKAKAYHDSIVGLLVRKKYWPDRDLLDANVARAFRDRLIKEIPPDNLVKMPNVTVLPNGEIGAFGYYRDAELALEPGDKLIYR